MKLIKKLLVSLLTLLLLTSCATIKHQMTYTIYPVGYLLNYIGGNEINATSIQNNAFVENATIVENYQEILDDSLYFFHIGNLEPYLDVYNEEFDQSEVEQIDLSTLNCIYSFGPYYKDVDTSDIDMITSDLYLWLVPIGMLSLATDIYNLLSSNYVEKAEYFKANYEKLKDELINLDYYYQSLANSLEKNEKEIKFVSMTPSFGNWVKAYNFKSYPICLSKYGALPTDSQLEAIKQEIIKENVKYIAFEPNMTDDMLDLFSQLESELNLKRINLSNISSLTQTQIEDGKDYFSLMNENLNVLTSIATPINPEPEQQ